MLAGRTTGIEPANNGVTVQRLTTWLRPPFFCLSPFWLGGDSLPTGAVCFDACPSQFSKGW